MIDIERYDMGTIDIAWCPGCGDFSILKIVKNALAELDIPPEKLVTVSGIGQAAKMPHYFRTNFFNGLHGRALPPATAIKASNPEMTVIVTSGDGDIYGEGGNHLLHAIRRNPDITVIVHDNMVYGLTKGQASPTSQQGFKTPVQLEGVSAEPFNPMALAVAMDASFVARTSSGEPEQAKEIVKAAIRHKGFSLVDVFQPCIAFNKVNTYAWFKEHTYPLEKEYDPRSRENAFHRALESEKMPLGIFYVHEKPVFEDSLAAYRSVKEPLYRRVEDRREKLGLLLRSTR